MLTRSLYLLRQLITVGIGFDSLRADQLTEIVLFKHSSVPQSIDKQQRFEKCFWEWFDALPPKTRATFHSYPADMAKIYFENKVWPELVKGELLGRRTGTGL